MNEVNEEIIMRASRGGRPAFVRISTLWPLRVKSEARGQSSLSLQRARGQWAATAAPGGEESPPQRVKERVGERCHVAINPEELCLLKN